MTQPRVLSSSCTVDSDYSACSVEFAPFDSSVLVCGTYQIAKDDDAVSEDPLSPKTIRLGRCLLFHVSKEGQLSERQRFDIQAILDMKWSHQAPHELGIATAGGFVRLYQLTESDGRSLKHLQDIRFADPGILCLSLDWSNRLTLVDTEIVVSLSNGSCAIASPRNGVFEVSEAWHAHDYEPWIAAWDYWHPKLVWTGGDDCKLKLWDLRAGLTSPIAVNKRFGGGVTSISSHHLVEHTFAVGSYDSQLRLFDDRSIKQPLSEINVGGGVWRARWHPATATQLLVACMHDGFKVVEAGAAFSTLSIASRMDEHQSLAYGADWAQIGEHTIAATCSFYDHQLKSWTV